MRDHSEFAYKPPANGLGRRSSRGRIAYLLCERISRAQMSNGGQNGCEVLLNLALAGQAVGLTPIHVSVTIKRLCNDGLIATTGRTVRILDIERLRALAEIDPIA